MLSGPRLGQLPSSAILLCFYEEQLAGRQARLNSSQAKKNKKFTDFGFFLLASIF